MPPQTLDNNSKISLESTPLANLCKALGHPARVKIIKYLKKMDKCICGQIVDILPLAQSTVSQHLKSLKDAGLIKGEINGPCTCYCLDKDVFEKFKQMVEQL
ncbi:MAG: metalloregulator ArsR/SmtB family transcription factor [Proteobacteria bacterium]|nr:metalloregulator ArsR/SmtB family transcription factor [Pseudomonadota bacterium]MBU1710561.1 metalloregulator ArsR/SmtB family transcription factor [Pseudomonadota bacterium]